MFLNFNSKCKFNNITICVIVQKTLKIHEYNLICISPVSKNLQT